MARLKISLFRVSLLHGLIALVSVSLVTDDVHARTSSTLPLNMSTNYIPSQIFTQTYQNTSDRRQQTVREMIKAFCPYNDYCQKQKEKDFPPLSKKIPCCASCSCEENCWETSTCCPDKERIDERDPTRTCLLSLRNAKNPTLYNGLNEMIYAYQVIDKCPESEQNLSIINKCSLEDIDSVNDYRWVSDISTGDIYQNEFCAACHGKKDLTYWPLEARCEDLLFSNFSHLHTYLLSGDCELLNKEPGTDIVPLDKRCAFPVYTRCNQTGLWTQYDADIDWACNAHNALYITESDIVTILYKNVFCYACNKQGVEDIQTICGKPFWTHGDLITNFRALIDYERVDSFRSDVLQSGSECKIDEIMDSYLQKCRELICPFGNAPFYGECKQLVEDTYGLTVKVIYSLTVLWSREDYKLKDKRSQLKLLGNEIIRGLQNSYMKAKGQECSVCLQELRFVNEIYQSKSSHNSTMEMNLEINTNLQNYKSTAPNFILEVMLHTDEKCQLPNLIQFSIVLLKSNIEITSNNKTDMLLHVSLVKENIYSSRKGTKVIYSFLRSEGCNFPAYTLNKERICPIIDIRFSEFEPFITEQNANFIRSMFTTDQMYSNECKEICVSDYFDSLKHSDVKFVRNVSTFILCMESAMFMKMMAAMLLL